MLVYLRRNRVRCGTGQLEYLSIAHNVWLPARSDGSPPQSRLMILVRLGRADQVCPTVVREVVAEVEHRLSLRQAQVAQGGTLETSARRLRRLEPGLRRLVSLEFGLTELVPCVAERQSLLRLLIADEDETSPLAHEYADLVEAIRDVRQGCSEA